MFHYIPGNKNDKNELRSSWLSPRGDHIFKFYQPGGLETQVNQMCVKNMIIFQTHYYGKYG